jgi:hypothetical protein
VPGGNILIVAPSAYPLGGVATWIDYIVPGLRQRGWRVTLGLTEGTLHNVDGYLAAHPMRGVIRIRNRTGTCEGRVRGLCHAIMAVQPDIVASVNIVDVYSAVNRLKRNRSLTLRAVMTLHGIEPDYYEQINRGAALLDAVIATNRLACRLASSLGGLESGRIYYAPYGVRLPEPLVTAPIKGLAPIRIGFVGRLDKPQKRMRAPLGAKQQMRTCHGYAARILGQQGVKRSSGPSGVERGTSKGSPEAMAEVWKQLYEHVWWRKPLHLESTRHFSPDRKARSFSKNPSDADFWPVPVDDLMPEIRRVLERMRGTPGGPI